MGSMAGAGSLQIPFVDGGYSFVPPVGLWKHAQVGGRGGV